MKYINPKMMVLFLFVVLFFSCSSKKIVIQNEVNQELNYIPYYLKVYEADSLYIVKNYQKSFEILDSLFVKYKPVNMSIYYELNTYYGAKIILNKNVEVSDFSRLISKYGYTKEIIQNDSVLNSYYQKNKFFLDKNYNDLRRENLASLNISLRNEIIEMISHDQLYRRSDFDKQNKIDSINEKKITRIFDNFGYPNEFVIGNSSIDNTYVSIDVLLLHTKDDERVNCFMPKVLEYIKKGHASPKIYANMKDQLELYHGREQYYGSYDNKTITPVDEMNKRRRSIGLPRYGYEKWRVNKLYPNLKL